MGLLTLARRSHRPVGLPGSKRARVETGEIAAGHTFTEVRTFPVRAKDYLVT